MESSPSDPNNPPKLNPDGTPYNFGIAGKPINPTLDAQGHTFEALKAARAKLEPLPKPDIQESVDELHNENIIPTLRTYESDIADAVKHKDVSKVKIAISENVRKQGNEDTVKPVRAFALSALSLVFIFAGVLVLMILGIGYAVQLGKNPPAGGTVLPPVHIVKTDAVERLLLPDNTTIGTALAENKPNLAGAPNSLIELSVQTGSTASSTPINSNLFIVRLPSSAPAILVRSLKPDFVLGYQLLSTPQPFIVFKTESYDNAFAGMLAWEKTLPADLSDLLLSPPTSQVPLVPQASSTPLNSSATSTNSHKQSTTTAPTVQNATPVALPTFHDGIVSNINVRIFKDVAGATEVVYALPDSSTIVITTNETTMEAVLNALKTTTFVQ